jgi:flavin reductase (DIM6/NTAB) family NADH-FMN oxidoreductase RutF
LTDATREAKLTAVTVTPQLYREIMACFPTGVAVVTAYEAGGREGLAVLYASKADEKFHEVRWQPPDLAEGGPVLLEDSAAYAVCVTRQAIEAGDHWVFIGEVRDGAVLEGRVPLVYHRRAFIDLVEPTG